MLVRRPFAVGIASGVNVDLAGRRIVLTPEQGFRASEQLLRASVAATIANEVDRAKARPKASPSKRKASKS